MSQARGQAPRGESHARIRLRRRLETTYGDTGHDEKKGSTTYRLFVTRKPVERLTKGELDRIVDDRVRASVKDWVAANGGDPKKAFGKVIRASARTARRSTRCACGCRSRFR